MPTTHTIIIPLGTGGGVVMGPYGDSNYALIPNVPEGEDSNDTSQIQGEHYSDEDRTIRLLAKYPYWLIDCGPQTAAWLCGGYGLVTPEKSTLMIQNLKGIMFTHAHTDHMGGLPMLLWRFIFVEKVKPTIIVHYELEASIRRICDEVRYWNGAQLQTLLPSDVQGLPANQERFRPELDRFVHLLFATTGARKLERFPGEAYPLFDTLELFRVDHNIDGTPAFGIKVTPHGGGPAFVFSGDSARPIPELADANNIVFHDCQTYNPDRATAVHCHLDWLDEAVPKIHRRRVYLVHTTKKPAECEGFQWAPRFSVLVF